MIVMLFLRITNIGICRIFVQFTVDDVPPVARGAVWGLSPLYYNNNSIFVKNFCDVGRHYFMNLRHSNDINTFSSDAGVRLLQQRRRRCWRPWIYCPATVLSCPWDPCCSCCRTTGHWASRTLICAQHWRTCTIRWEGGGLNTNINNAIVCHS